MAGIRDLLIDLGKDAELAAEYARNPRAVMARYGCSSDDVQAMLDKDVDKLKQASGLSELESNGIIKAYDYK
ncbi:MAG: hypothetical protein RQ847_05315 [Wenzhouxiangellaceae bacterium]|nr:hypothetical protein [Wenzhouxiangellaceae bacterium]